MSSRPRVALIVESSTVFGRQVLHGIGRYLRLHQPWSIFLEQREFGALPPSWLLRRRWDGVICRPTDRRLADAFLKTETPVIDLNSLRSDLPFVRIRSDNRGIGVMGAEHLLERGFQRFAFCGYSVVEWSTLRRDGFFDALARSGKSCELYESAWRGGHMPEWEKDQDRMAQWIYSLPKPCGIMACNDSRGQQLLDACLRVDVSVPEGVAVIGVDNDELLCEFCDPPLSSVMPNPQRIGFEAAAMLDQFMKGVKPEKQEMLIEPLGVATRQSSDVLAVEDPHIASAMSYIRDHALNGCTVQDLLECVPLSRSSLERRFRKYLGRSPQSEIHACRLKRVKQLLSETDLTLSRIAELVGYEHPEYMSVVFRRETGQTPGAYRRRAQIEQPQAHRRMVLHEDSGDARRPELAGALKEAVH
jgi:LacI family transcriptional regulator